MWNNKKSEDISIFNAKLNEDRSNIDSATTKNEYYKSKNRHLIPEIKSIPAFKNKQKAK